MPEPRDPLFFSSPAEFRRWLARHHAAAAELWVGYWKKGTGIASLTWQESVDEALCYGWIDGVRKSIDARRYTIRFTPRRPGSNWSTINIRRIKELIRAGRLKPAGLRACQARDPAKSGVYSFERRSEARLPPDAEARFRTHMAAWEYFQLQPPGYRRVALHWILSAKREETRAKRLATLIEDSAAKRRIAPLRRPEKSR